jgi:hypothetical protein
MTRVPSSRTPRCSQFFVMRSIVHVAALLVASVLAVACGSTAKDGSAATVENVQYTFASPEEAGLALANAAATLDGDQLRRIFGPDVAVLSSGDAAQDDLDLQRFVLAYDRANSIRRMSDSEAALVVGERGWAFPVPLVRDGDRWHFDTVAGGNVVRAARIEENEERAVMALAALAGAERTYYDMDADGDGTRTYATRITSSPGTRDGLFWTDDLGGPESPVGVGLAVADATLPSPEPYDGYLFRVLPSPGITVVAFPAVTGETGRRTFVVANGVVWARDVGQASRSTAMAMVDFAPDASWTQVAIPNPGS